MNLEEQFPLRYWINLGRRSERRAETEWRLLKAGITAERFPAVDARFVRKTRGYESAGRYALALTQRLAIRKAMLAGAESVLILEDDVVFHPEILERIAELELPDDWGIFYLGCAHHKRPWPAAAGIVRTPYALDTHAFAVRAPYYRRVISALDASKPQNRLKTHARASDWYLADLHGEIPTYACYPNLAWQAVVTSDLTGGTYSNYTKTGEQQASSGELIGLQAKMWGGSRWRAPVAALRPHREPKLGLLFLTRQDVNHPGIWREFLDDAGDGVRAFAHVKDREHAGLLHEYRIDEWHETKWGDISLVLAMLALLRAAMADGTLTHFAFVSESCVPIRPWTEIRRRLMIDGRSMMDMVASGSEVSSPHRERLEQVKDLPERAMRVHSQWSLLNREAAECIVEHDFTERFASIMAPDEHYFGTVLALRGFDEGSRMQNVAPTWVRWTKDARIAHPEEYLSTNLPLISKLAASPSFFARKFPAASDIGRWGLHRNEISGLATPAPWMAM